jgi:dihydroflavonol-4-reductase
MRQTASKACCPDDHGRCLGEKRRFSSAKAQELLGWRPRPLEETVLDCARSLIAIGAV